MSTRGFKGRIAREITPPSVYRERRRFLRVAVGAGLLPAATLMPVSSNGARREPSDVVTAFEEVTGYNNFYEYTTDKKAVAALAENLAPRPWQVTIKGEVERESAFDVDALIRTFGVEERVYRLRCVEGWSAVIPWQGFPLARLIAHVKPTPRAKYVRFVSPLDPSRFYAQRRGAQPWPYVEGLTIEEAMHPLSLLATGMYGRTMPNQNGAPIRLVVPWKYGFKSIKSIVAIVFEETRPISFWTKLSPEEYGFYANVNPSVPHPRWSQTRELRLGELRKRPTALFNGYADEVEALYRNLDLVKNP